MPAFSDWGYRHWVWAGFTACSVLVGCGGTDNNGGAHLIAVTTCNETFTACGGDPTGTWQYTSACSDPDMTTTANQQIAAQYPTCSTMFTSVALSLGGSVTLGSGTYSQAITESLVTQMSLNSACFAAVNSGVSLSATTCNQYQTGLNRVTGASATCGYDGANCNCADSLSRQDNESGTYTVSGLTMTSTSVDAGVSQTTSADFCVQGNSMTMREVSDGGITSISHLSK